MPISTDCREVDARGAVRASLYLAATLYCDDFSAPVKVRNLSTTGALVEAGTVPGNGALVQLVRGSLIVHGLVIWSLDGRCGLKFSGCIDVPRWRACPANVEQQRVDEVVRLVKAGAVPLPVPTLGHANGPADSADPDADLSGDLKTVSELLEQLGDVLASDADVAARHGSALQHLDIAMQVIAAVDAMLTGRFATDTDAARLAGLRRSADQALGRLA